MRINFETHRVVARVVAVRTLVDLAELLLVHPQVPLEVAGQRRAVVAVLAGEADVAVLVLARVAMAGRKHKKS